MGSAMSNEISSTDSVQMQKVKATDGFNGTQKQNLGSLPDLRDLQTTNLDPATVLALAHKHPDSKQKIFVQYLLSQNIEPFENCPFQSAGIIDFLTERWNFEAKPEMKLLLKLAKLGEMTKTQTRLASIEYFKNMEQKKVQEETIIVTVDSPKSDAAPASSSDKVSKAWGKGVGYGSEYTGDNSDWDVVGWKNNSVAQEQEIAALIDEIMTMASEKFAEDLIIESSLIPAILNYCKNDSFQDITSRYKLYTSIFNTILVFVKNFKFLPLLFEDHGMTLAEQICKIGRQAEHVVKLGESVDDSFEDDSTRLANLIADVYKSLLESIENCMAAIRVSQVLTNDTSDLEPLLSKLQSLRESFDSNGEEPVIDLLKTQDATNEDYEAIMRELCFGSVEEMSEFGPHKYKKEHVRVKRKLMKRLAGEFADFPQSLPIHHESSIFFRFCEEKMSHAQMLIIPADGTPYGAGCFIFDVKFPADYPNSPPKVNLATTGHGAVRFNPNLYNCGKVCLSLLGTWEAYSQGEKWNPEVSTFLQVAISIQSLIFVAEPFYNEPGDEDSMGTSWGDQQSRAYNVVIQSGTTKYAMIEMLENPPAAWKNVIETHFTLQGDRALKNVTEWLGEEHGDTKRLAELLSNLRSKVDSSSEEVDPTRSIGA